MIVLLVRATARVIALPVDERDAAEGAGKRPAIEP